MPCYDSRNSGIQYIERFPSDYHDLKRRLDHATRVACALYRFAVAEGKISDDDVNAWWNEHQQDDVKREAKAAADEREACAKVADANNCGNGDCCDAVADLIASRIRDRKG